MKRSFRHIRDHLEQPSEAHAVLDLLAQQQTLIEELRAQLPDALGAHCLDLTLSNGRLTLFFDSTAWLTRARFLVGEILTSLKSYHVNAVGFQIKLPERPAAATALPLRRVQLSETAAQHLLDAAAHQSDPRLSAALRRLARHGTPPTDATD